MSDYPPIERHGIVGNLETCALVTDEGVVDWCCIPHLESPSIFGALVDDDIGGRFALTPAAEFESEQRYLDRTNVLETRFQTGDGEVTVTDFMPVHAGESTPVSEQALYRRISGESGRVTVDVRFEPRFNYAESETAIEAVDGGLVVRRANGRDTDDRDTEGEDGEREAEESTQPRGVDRISPVALASDATFAVEDGTATASVTVGADESRWFVIDWGTGDDASDRRDGDRDVAAGVDDHLALDPETNAVVLSRTVDYWRDWAHTCEGETCAFEGPWHDHIVRSTLVLRLLIHHRVGSVCAAPTTSLPESVGGVRNWDYRYNWVRDSAFTVLALLHVGHRAEAISHVEWFLDVSRADRPEDIQPLYGLHGDTDLTERTIDHLSGYRDSEPVRVGNAATEQDQHDIFGEFVLVISKAFSGIEGPTRQDWESIRSIVDYVVEVWDEPDSGIWEVRGDERHFVYSKLMDWVALDRGIAMAEEKEFTAPVETWRETRSAVRAEILERGWDDELGAFVQSYGDDALDATALLIPIMGFLPVDDERVQSTIDAVMDRLLVDDGLVRRYDGDDNLPGTEGTFVFCSFWLVMALALSGRLGDAKRVYGDVLSHANPLGLFAEEIDPETGEHLGNFPQAISHVGVVDAAVYLAALEDREYPGAEPLGIELQRTRDGTESTE